MDDNSSHADKVVRVASSILLKAFQRQVGVSSPTRLTEPGRRNILWRVTVDGGADLPETLVVKQRTPELYNPNVPSEPGTRGFLNDWAGLAFLERITQDDPPLAPRFFGGDQVHGIILIEDLGDERTSVHRDGEVRQESPSLVQPLLGADPAIAATALEQMMRLLGRLHARTAGQLETYRTIRRGLDPNWDDALSHKTSLDGLKGVTAAIAEVGVPITQAFEAELERLRAKVSRPGPWLVFGHGDPCPDNWFEIGGQLRLIDFEFAGPQHALLDGSYAHLPFPTCWCCGALPAELSLELEWAYREEAARGVPEVGDVDAFRRALADVTLLWTLNALQWCAMAKNKDGTWGTASIRARIVHRLSLTVVTPEMQTSYPTAVEVTKRLLAVLRERWGDLKLPSFPAFAARLPYLGPQR